MKRLLYINSSCQDYIAIGEMFLEPDGSYYVMVQFFTLDYKPISHQSRRFSHFLTARSFLVANTF